MKLNRIAAMAVSAPLMMLMAAPAYAEDMADKAVGVWLREKTGWLVEFSMCGDKLCGEVIAGEGVDKKTGESVVGTKMLYDLKKVGPNRWKGKMYNPGDGGTYAGKVIVRSDNEIKMAGCMMGVMCRSEIWPRAEKPEPMGMGDAMDDMAGDMSDDMDDMADSMADDMSDQMDDMMDDAAEKMEMTDE